MALTQKRARTVRNPSALACWTPIRRLALVLSMLSLTLVLACTQSSSPAGKSSPGVSGKQVTSFRGIARNVKGGPALVVEGEKVWVSGLGAWPKEAAEQQVVVSGKIIVRKGLSREDAQEIQGIGGPHRAIEVSTWRLEEPDL